MGEKKTKNVVIIALCLTLIFMGVGFAALSQNINIKATGTVSGKTAWDIHYATFALNEKGGNAADTTPEATAGGVKYLDTAKTTATVTFTLTAPRDYVEYKGTITNFGSIDAKLNTYTSSFNTDNEYVTKTITIGGESIAANASNEVTSPAISLVKGATTGSSTDVVVRYTLKDTVTELPAEAQTVTDSIVFGFVQQ